MISENYHCQRCDARFGIAGDPDPYTDDDRAADEEYDRQVEWHESGECSPAPEPHRTQLTLHLGDTSIGLLAFTSSGRQMATISLGGMHVMAAEPDQWERLAQACLDAANAVRDKADPPATVAKVADLDVVLAPYLGVASLDGPRTEAAS